MAARKICIYHLNQIGDLVFTLPLLKSLRDYYPDAAIHSVLQPYLEGLLKDSPFVDRVILRGKSFRSRFELMKTLRDEQYDLFITLARSQEGLLLAGLSGAKLKAGFAHFPWDAALDVKDVIQGHNSWYNNANLLRKLGIPVSQNNYLGLLRIDNPAPVQGLPERYFVVSPGASKRRLIKAWDEARFGELIMRLREGFGLHPVLVGGQDTKECTSAIAANAEGIEITNLAGEIGLRDLYSVLKGASLFVGIDSGVMHMASAIDIPVVALFGPTDEFYVGPQNAKSIVVRQETDCAPCYLREACEHRKCMTGLGVDEVFEACGKLVQEPGVA